MGLLRKGTTRLLSIERADWLKLHDMFNARDAKSWQRQFPVGFPVKVCVLILLFTNIFHDVVARIESRYVIKSKYVLLVLLQSEALPDVYPFRYFSGGTREMQTCCTMGLLPDT